HAGNYAQVAKSVTDELAATTAAYLKLVGEKCRLERELRDVIAGRAGGWDAARVRREQHTAREMARLYTLLFARTYGKEPAKDILESLGSTTFATLPPEAHLSFILRCEEYSLARREG